MSTDVLKVSGDYLIDARNGNITLNVTSATFTGTVSIIGNLDVTGQTTQLESVNTVIKDNILTLNDGETNNYVTAGTSGLLISRGLSNSPTQAATFLYDDGQTWHDSTGTAYRGWFEFKSQNRGSAINVSAIRTNSTLSSTLNILGAENAYGMINVIGTVDYETRVLHDDDIPNKLYVDQALYAGTTQAQKIQVGNTLVFLNDNAPSVPFNSPYFGAPAVIAALGTTTNVVFRLQGSTARIQGLTIDDTVIRVNTSTNLVLQASSGYSINLENPIRFIAQTTSTAAVANQSALYYSGTAGGGGTGLYFVNTSQQDELISRRKAIVYAIIF